MSREQRRILEEDMIAALIVMMAAATTAPSAIVQIGAEELGSRPTLCLVAEMGSIPEADTWTACGDGAFAKEAEAFQAAWVKESGWVAGHVTADVVRALSRWAKPQMEKYAAVPALDKLKFTPMALEQRTGMVVYEATVDNLPVHNALVKRWLKIYVLCSGDGKTILRVTVTIRGQVEE